MPIENTCKSSVERHEVAPLLLEDVLVEEEDAHAAGAAADDRVDDGNGDHVGVSGF